MFSPQGGWVTPVNMIDAGTISITGVTTNPTKGTTVRDKVYYYQNSGNTYCIYQFEQSSAGTAGSGDYLYSLPSGITADITIIPNDNRSSLGTAAARVVPKGYIGHGWISNQSATDTGSAGRGQVQAFLYSSTQFRLVITTDFAVINAQNSSNYALSNSNLGLCVRIEVPNA